MKPQRPKHLLVKSPAGVSERAAMELVPELDEHLAALSVLFHQYLKHAWLLEATSLEAHVTVVRAGHEKALASMGGVARRILELGGVPLCGPTEQMNVSYLEHEDEGVYHPQEMLRHDLAHERVMTGRLEVTIETAQDLNDEGTAGVLAWVLSGSLERALGLERTL